jgi:hypothetical protein
MKVLDLYLSQRQACVRQTQISMDSPLPISAISGHSRASGSHERAVQMLKSAMC